MPRNFTSTYQEWIESRDSDCRNNSMSLPADIVQLIDEFTSDNLELILKHFTERTRSLLQKCENFSQFSVTASSIVRGLFTPSFSLGLVEAERLEVKDFATDCRNMLKKEGGGPLLFSSVLALDDTWPPWVILEKLCGISYEFVRTANLYAYDRSCSGNFNEILIERTRIPIGVARCYTNLILDLDYRKRYEEHMPKLPIASDKFEDFLTFLNELEDFVRKNQKIPTREQVAYKKFLNKGIALAYGPAALGAYEYKDLSEERRTEKDTSSDSQSCSLM